MAKSTKTAEAAAATTVNHIPKKEFWIFTIAALGQSLVYSCMSSYVTDYYINVLRLAPMFVLLLMLLARVWDAINDPLMGMIVDRHKTKWGRMKPYPVITAIPIAILTILMFYKPNLVDGPLMIYTAAVYVMWGMIYTSSDVPFWSLPNIMTPNPEERGKLISLGRTFGGISTGIVTVLPMIIGPVLKGMGYSDVEADEKKYMIMALSCAIIGVIVFSTVSFSAKERIHIPNAKSKKGTGEKSTLYRIFHCKPLMLIVLAGTLSFGRYMLQAAAPHVARYAGFHIKDDFQSNVTAVALIIQVCAAIGMFGAMIVVPFLYKKFNYKQLMIYTCIAGFAASVITCVIGWSTHNLYFCIPTMIISAIPLGVINVVSYAMVCDSLDYMEWETGHRDTALGSACQSFVNKLGNALSTVMIIAMYMLVEIDVNSMYDSTGAASINLSSNQEFAMFALVTIVPGISLLLCAIPIFFYDIVGEKKDKITRELAQQRAEKGITVE